MDNKISIDQLVHEKLHDGQEPHNLGAWANMERLLDGKNPYTTAVPSKDKKRWLPLLLLLLIGSGAVLGGYYTLAPGNNGTITKTNNDRPSTLEKAATTLSSSPVKMEEMNNANISKTSKANKTSQIALPVNKHAHRNRITSNKQTTVLASIEPTYTKDESRNLFKKPTANSTSPNSHSNPPKKQSTKTKNTLIDVNKGNDLVQNEQSTTKQQETLPNANINPPTGIDQAYKLDTSMALHVKENISKNAQGQFIRSLDSSEIEVVNKVKNRIPVVNPRFVDLDKTQQEKAEKRTLTASKDELIPLTDYASANKINQTKNSVGTSKNELKSVGTMNAKTTQQQSFLSKIKKVYSPIFQRMSAATINIADKQIPIYPGMIVGVNAAVANAQHNFGGFQGGLTAMTPLNRFLSISIEGRFIHKNNSGYTVTDFNHNIRSTVIDTNSLFSSSIYNYQIDSVAIGYNFQSFYNLQFPVLLNYHLNDFTFYSGINLEYGLRMNAKQNNKTYTVSYSDTIPSSLVYTPRGDVASRFGREDFGPRLGLGYTIGAAYSFNPNLYLDFRLSNTFWDNSATSSKKEISSVFYKIPSIQFSLGYRFRKFERDQE